MRFKLLILGAVLIPAAALAAPFCVATPFGPQCWYYDRDSCERAAAQTGASCVLNREEMAERERPAFDGPIGQSRSSGAPYCVVTGHGNQCWYYDEQTCQRAAESANGYCAYNR